MAISYFSLEAYTKSLEKTYTNQVSQLVSQVAEQTSAKLEYLITDLENQTTQPYIQLSFQQYRFKTRLLLLRERLELFRTASSVYSNLSLCFLDGEQLISTAFPKNDPQFIEFERNNLSNRDAVPEQIFHRIYRPNDELALFLPVHSFRQSTKVVGYLVAYIPMSSFALYLEKLNLGQHTEKSILTTAGETVTTFPSDNGSQSIAQIREYSSDVAPLNWRIVVRINENELFHDVIRLKDKSLMFIGSVIALAFVASYFFSHGFIKPFRQIIAGTHFFAKGDLEHRIEIKSGHEAKQLASAFNDMAKQLNERRMELNQAIRLASLGVMAAGIGHEIKNPLAGIKTSSQVINKILSFDDSFKADNPEIKELMELAKGISDEADRLTKILDDLLKFGRPRKPYFQRFDIAGTVEHAVSLVQSEFDKRGVTITTQMVTVKVHADSDQILQVLLNLLSNSLKAAPPQTGWVKITSSLSRQGNAVLNIVDNGVGIAEDKIQHIFDPFFSLREDGTGLGLSVVYTLLKQNNARLEVTSEKNMGTNFKILFAGDASKERGM